MIQDHVTSLELSKQLYEAGIKIESEFYHWVTEVEEDGLAWWDISSKGKEPRKGKKVRDYFEDIGRPICYPAPLSSELGELLPDHIDKMDLLSLKWHDKKWNIYYQDKDNEKIIDPVSRDTEANARAKMLLYLKEKGLIK